MNINRFNLIIFLASTAFVTLAPSEGMAREVSSCFTPVEPSCFRDVGSIKNVSRWESSRFEILMCGREEYTSDTPYR